MLERMMGVEPTLPAWEAEVLPMNYIRVWKQYITRTGKIQPLISAPLRRKAKCPLPRQLWLWYPVEREHKRTESV